jgi:lipopolysaccharide transport system permease protein
MHKLIIDADQKRLGIDLKEILSYKDLFLILAYRDLRVRYAQTFLGLLWGFIQPLITLVIFILVFGKAVKVDTGNIPYPLFALCGMCAWTYFAFVMSQAGNSLIGAQGMIQKIYFPRLIIPLSKAVVGLVDFIIILVFIGVLMVVYKIPPTSNIVFLPIFIIMTVLAALSVGIWLSALTIRYRDFQIIVPFLVQIGLYATPIAYPASLIPEKYKLLYYINPLAGIVEGFRWSILGANRPDVYSFISYCIVFILLITGLIYFRKIEDIVADIV